MDRSNIIFAEYVDSYREFDFSKLNTMLTDFIPNVGAFTDEQQDAKAMAFVFLIITKAQYLVEVANYLELLASKITINTGEFVEFMKDPFSKLFHRVRSLSANEIGHINNGWQCGNIVVHFPNRDETVDIMKAYLRDNALGILADGITSSQINLAIV